MSEVPLLAGPGAAPETAPVPADAGERTYDVAELLELLGAAVTDALPTDVWIRGQIRNLHRSRRLGKVHVYFDLVAPAPAERSPAAALAVVLFDGYRQVVNRDLGSGATGHMVDGVEVRIRGRAGVYAVRGRLQLEMHAIDPDYTLSRLASDRERLLGELAAAGLLERNRALALPTLPLRVGLVTSARSAAEADFRHVLAGSGAAWEVLLVDTPVQGFGSERLIAAALAAAERGGADVIALVRGGGARTELATFDSEAVARAVATRGVPVVTGIGHEIDRSVADLVAHTACNTPTAAAAFLADRVADFDAAVLGLWREIAAAAAAALASDRRRLAEAHRRVAGAAAGACATNRRVTARQARDLARAAQRGTQRADLQLRHRQEQLADRSRFGFERHRRALAAATERLLAGAGGASAGAARRLEALEAQVQAYDPQRALERGWSITYDADGRMIRSVGEIVPGATLRTRMSDGTVTSIALAVTPNERSGDSG